MAQLKMNAMVANLYVGEKKWNGELQKDSRGNVLFNRKLTLVDLDSEHADIFKVNVPEAMLDTVRAFIKKNASILCDVGTMNGSIFLRLAEIK